MSRGPLVESRAETRERDMIQSPDDLANLWTESLSLEQRIAWRDNDTFYDHLMIHTNDQKSRTKQQQLNVSITYRIQTLNTSIRHDNCCG